nr:hypothetical protein [Pandoravirus belohorizontensis]
MEGFGALSFGALFLFVVVVAAVPLRRLCEKECGARDGETKRSCRYFLSLVKRRKKVFSLVRAGAVLQRKPTFLFFSLGLLHVRLAETSIFVCLPVRDSFLAAESPIAKIRVDR